MNVSFMEHIHMDTSEPFLTAGWAKSAANILAVQGQHHIGVGVVRQRAAPGHRVPVHLPDATILLPDATILLQEIVLATRVRGVVACDTAYAY